MAHDQPDLPEILRTLREFVVEIGPRLEGLDRYHALCAQQLIDVCLRELDEWTRVETPGDTTLRDLAGAPADVPIGTVIADLCQSIRAGRFDEDLDGLRDALLSHVVEKVNVTRPDALAPEHRQASQENDT